MSRSPVIVYDTNHDALERRVGALRSLDQELAVVGVTSRTAVLVMAESVPDDTLVLVDLFATDRVALDRPGERLIRRLLRSPATAHVRPVAWSAQLGPDVVQGVRSAGGRGFVGATLDREQEPGGLQRALDGDEVWPVDCDVTRLRQREAWQTWFEEHFGLPWEPWIEPTLVRLASSRERGAVVDELVERSAARSSGQAATRLRMVARAVAGEHRNSAAAVAAGASLALSQIAAHRPLAERPDIAVSLEQAARTIRSAPSLTRAAGLTPEEAEEVLAIDDLIQAQRLMDRAGAGAPAADQVRNERRWAAGRRARDRGASLDDIDAVIAGILVRLDDVLGALDDARQDELYHPEGRAAAALTLVRAGEAEQLAGVGIEARGGVVTWCGHSAQELAMRGDAAVDDLRRVSDAIDALVRERTD